MNWEWELLAYGVVMGFSLGAIVTSGLVLWAYHRAN